MVAFFVSVFRDDSSAFFLCIQIKITIGTIFGVICANYLQIYV